MTAAETARADLLRIARDIPVTASREETNKELLARFPYGKRKGTMYNAWRGAIAFHLRERDELASWNQACAPEVPA